MPASRLGPLPGSEDTGREESDLERSFSLNTRGNDNYKGQGLETQVLPETRLAGKAGWVEAQLT